jgi:hypothetical protein
MALMRTDRGRCRLCAAAALLLVAACAGGPSTTVVRPAEPGAEPAPPGAAPALPPEPLSRPSLGLFSRIRAPTEVEPNLELVATGVQIFRCEPDREGFHWAFRLPEAELRDARKQVVAHHGANYSFEHVDGSRLLGTIAGYDSAPVGDAVHWLLLRTQSYGQGEFEKVTYVQRVDTAGGVPPEQCSADQVSQVLRVPFSAKFVFYRPR